MNFEFKIIEFFNLPVKIMFSICICTGLILFLPDNLVNKIYIEDIRNKYGFIIGIIFLITVAIITVKFIILIYTFFSNLYYYKKFKKTSKIRLLNLNDYQKAIVCSLYLKDNYTEKLPINDGGVLILRQNMVITEISTQYFVNDINNAKIPFMLNPWVVEILKKDSKVEESVLVAYKKYAT